MNLTASIPVLYRHRLIGPISRNPAWRLPELRVQGGFEHYGRFAFSLNLLAPELLFLIFAHSVYKM